MQKAMFGRCQDMVARSPRQEVFGPASPVEFLARRCVDSFSLRISIRGDRKFFDDFAALAGFHVEQPNGRQKIGELCLEGLWSGQLRQMRRLDFMFKWGNGARQSIFSFDKSDSRFRLLSYAQIGLELADPRHTGERALFSSFLSTFAERLSAWQLEQSMAAAQDVSAQKAASAPKRASSRITKKQVAALTDFLLGEPVKPARK
ncbi:MAG: hypothetical protein WC901_01320 [Candidatus Margulisiibacteriota bacterium]